MAQSQTESLDELKLYQARNPALKSWVLLLCVYAFEVQLDLYVYIRILTVIDSVNVLAL